MAMMGSGYERRPEPEAPAGPRLRVYELAKDLNVQPKDLLNKIRAMGIDVANHMSHLESVDVDRVRRAVERERLENLEEVRLNDTVIRRRSKSARRGHRRPRSRRRAVAAPPPTAARLRRARREPAAPVAVAPERRRRHVRPRAPRSSSSRRRVAAPSAPAAAARHRRPRRRVQPRAASVGSAGAGSVGSSVGNVGTHSRRPPRSPPAQRRAQDDRPAGRHRIGGDGRVHPASRRAAARRRHRCSASRSRIATRSCGGWAAARR